MSECKFNPHDLFFDGCGNPKDSHRPKMTKFKLTEDGDVFDEDGNFMGKGRMTDDGALIVYPTKVNPDVETF